MERLDCLYIYKLLDNLSKLIFHVSFEFKISEFGDSNGHAIDVWDWALKWKKVPLPRRQQQSQKRATDLYRLSVLLLLVISSLLSKPKYKAVRNE